MKIVGFIPYLLGYHNYENAETGEAMSKLGGRYILNYSLELLNRSDTISDTIIFASSPQVLDYVEKQLDYTFLKRDRSLDLESVTIDEIIAEFLKKTDADIVVMLHPNSPFLSLETLEDCIKKVTSKEYGSAFIAYQFKKFSWFNGKPLNYSLDEPTPPKLSDIEPVYIELSSLYVFSRQTFYKRNKRVGENPYICSVDHFEGHEIHTEEDHDIAELMVNSGLYVRNH